MAALANVSETTVSVVLNDNRNIVIAPETRERVLQAAEQLGYRPNYPARAMASRKSATLGILSPWNAEVWFFAQMLNGVRRTASERGYGILLCNLLDRHSGPEDCIHYYREGRIDGVVYLPPTEAGLPGLELLRGEKIPAVLCNGIDPAGEMDSVIIDYAFNIYKAVEALLNAGFSNLSYIMPDEMQRLCYGDRERVKGFDRAVSDFSAGPAGKEVFRLDAGIGERLDTAGKILRACGKPAGIVTCYWVYAYYFQIAAMKLGLRPGKDLKVIAGDCPVFTRDLYPGVTGIDLPFDEIGRLSAGMLIDRLEGKAHEPRQMKIESFSCSI